MKKLYIVHVDGDDFLVLAQNGGEALKEVVGDIENYEDSYISVKELDMNGKTQVIAEEYLG